MSTTERVRILWASSRLADLAEDLALPIWLRAEARAAIHDLDRAADEAPRPISGPAGDVLLGAWLGGRIERRRHEPAEPDDPARLRARTSQAEEPGKRDATS